MKTNKRGWGWGQRGGSGDEVEENAEKRIWVEREKISLQL